MSAVAAASPKLDVRLLAGENRRLGGDAGGARTRLDQQMTRTDLDVGAHAPTRHMAQPPTSNALDDAALVRPVGLPALPRASAMQ